MRVPGVVFLTYPELGSGALMSAQKRVVKSGTTELGGGGAVLPLDSGCRCRQGFVACRAQDGRRGLLQICQRPRLCRRLSCIQDRMSCHSRHGSTIVIAVACPATLPSTCLMCCASAVVCSRGNYCKRTYATPCRSTHAPSSSIGNPIPHTLYAKA